MIRIIDYDSKVPLGPASHELIARWQEAQKTGKNFIKIRISTVDHRVFLEEVPYVAVRGAYTHERYVFGSTLVTALRVTAAADLDQDQHLRWPHCHCSTPTLWAERKLDGRWSMSAEEAELEQRTCLLCGTSMSREIGR